MRFGDKGSSIDRLLFFIGLAPYENFLSPNLQAEADQIFLIISTIAFILYDSHEGNRFFMVLYLKILLLVLGHVLHIAHLDGFLLGGDYLDQFDGL